MSSVMEIQLNNLRARFPHSNHLGKSRPAQSLWGGGDHGHLRGKKRGGGGGGGGGTTG